MNPTNTDTAGESPDNEVFNLRMREIDAFIRAGKLVEAKEGLDAVRSLDPHNPYVTAFEERIAHPTTVERKKVGGDAPQKTPEEMVRERESLEVRLRNEIESEYNARFTDELRTAELKASEMLAQEQEKLLKQRELIREHFARNFETLRKQLDDEFKEKLEEHSTQRYQARLAEERQRIETEAERELVKETSQLRDEYEKKLADATEAVKSLRANLKGDMERNFIKRLEQIQREYDGKMELLGLSMPNTKDGRIQLYRQRLSSVYLSGGPTLEQAKDLMRLKELLELTFDDHLAVESDARIEQYVKELERGITGGSINFNDKERLEELKKKYRLQPAEAARLEPFILDAFRKASMKATILIADDEDDFRLPVQELLEAQGYHVASCPSVHDALEQLKKTKVDLILSDIKFLPGEPDGFKFFKTVNANPDLRNIPFILLSSLTDDVIVRSGMQLGIDDYLTKPIDPDMLLAVVVGRLRRLRRAN